MEHPKYIFKSWKRNSFCQVTKAASITSCIQLPQKNKKEMSKLNRNNYTLNWEFKVIDSTPPYFKGEQPADFLLRVSRFQSQGIFNMDEAH